MEFSGITKPTDIIAFQLYFNKTNPSIQKSISTQRIGILAIMSIFTVFLMIWGGISVFTVGYAIFAVGFYFWIPYSFDKRLKKQIVTIVNTTMQKHFGKYTVNLTEESIKHTDSTGEQIFYWSSVDKAAIVDNHLFIMVGAMGLAIDCNDFSKEQSQAIVGFVRAHVKN